MRKDKEKQIDGHMYRVTQFGTTEALRVWTQLVKLAGPSVAEIGGSLGGGSGLLDAEITPDAIARAVEALAAQLEEDMVVDFSKRLLSQTLRDGDRINFELDFQGQIVHMFRVLAWVLEVNFGDFLDALGANADRVQAVRAAAQATEGREFGTA